MIFVRKKQGMLKEELKSFDDLERKLAFLESQGVEKIDVVKADFTVDISSTKSLSSFLSAYFPKRLDHSLRGTFYDFQDGKRFGFELKYLNSKLVNPSPDIGFAGAGLSRGRYLNEKVLQEDMVRTATINVYVTKPCR